MVLWHLELICKSNVEKFEAGWMDAKEALKCKPRLMVHSGKSSEDPGANRNADSKGLVQTVPEEMKTISNWAKVHSNSDKNISCVLPVFYKFRVSLKVID